MSAATAAGLAIIVDPDSDSRARFKQALSEFSRFSAIESIDSFEGTLRRLALRGGISAIFLSQRFNPTQMFEFLEQARLTPNGRECLYILVMHSQIESKGTLGSKFMAGFNGFIVEPYSSEQIIGVLDLAAKLQNEARVNKNRVGLTLLATDIIELIDTIALLKSSGFDSNKSSERLRELCLPLANLEEESRQLFHQILFTLLDSIQAPPRKTIGQDYRGMSDRVRRRMEDRILREVEEVRHNRHKAASKSAHQNQSKDRDADDKD